jgi:hypothetical protein
MGVLWTFAYKTGQMGVFFAFFTFCFLQNVRLKVIFANAII